MSQGIELSAPVRRIASAIIMRGQELMIEDDRFAALCSELTAHRPAERQAFVEEILALIAKAVRLAEGDWERLASQLLTLALLVGGEELVNEAAASSGVPLERARSLLAQPAPQVPMAVGESPKANLLDILKERTKP